MLNQSSNIPDDCGSDLEHLFSLAGCFDLQLHDIYGHVVCANHRDYLLNIRRRKNNCHLCVDVFGRKKRSVSDLRQISKYQAIRIWRIHGLNVYVLIYGKNELRILHFFCRYNGWFCSLCRKTCAIEYAIPDDDQDPFEWL